MLTTATKYLHRNTQISIFLSNWGLYGGHHITHAALAELRLCWLICPLESSVIVLLLPQPGRLKSGSQLERTLNLRAYYLAL